MSKDTLKASFRVGCATGDSWVQSIKPPSTTDVLCLDWPIYNQGQQDHHEEWQHIPAVVSCPTWGNQVGPSFFMQWQRSWDSKPRQKSCPFVLTFHSDCPSHSQPFFSLTCWQWCFWTLLLSASLRFPVWCFHRSVTVSCTTGSNLWPSVWLITAQVNVTNQTTKSLFGLCLRRRHRIFKPATSACRVCQLFPRGAGMRARGHFFLVVIFAIVFHLVEKGLAVMMCNWYNTYAEHDCKSRPLTSKLKGIRKEKKKWKWLMPKERSAF